MKIASDSSISRMPQSWPGVPSSTVCGGYSVQPPPVGPPGDEEAREQHDDREQVDPEAQHVHVREHHVPGAAHERNQVVAEPAEEQRRQQVDDHDHAVHGHELIIVVRRDEAEGVREADLQPHQQRQHERDEPDADRHAAVLDRDDLVVLAPDVLLDERLGSCR